MRCPICHNEKDDLSRIRVEIVDKKTREIIEEVYGEITCVECMMRRYKEKTKLRLYV